MIKRVCQAKDNQFLFQNVQCKMFEIFKMFKNDLNSLGQPFELPQNLAIEKIAPHAW